MKSNGVKLEWNESEQEERIWLSHTHFGPKWGHCLKWACGALLSITSSWALYIPSRSDTYSKEVEREREKSAVATASELKYSWGSFLTSSALCVFFSLLVHIRFDFLPFRLFFLLFFLYSVSPMLCSSTEPHCVLFRLQIASSVLLLISFRWNFFRFLHSLFPWIPFYFSTSYTAWCPLVGNILHLFCSFTLWASYTFLYSLSYACSTLSTE